MVAGVRSLIAVGGSSQPPETCQRSHFALWANGLRKDVFRSSIDSRSLQHGQELFFE